MTPTSFHSERIARRHRGREIRKRNRRRQHLSPDVARIIDATTAIWERYRAAADVVAKFLLAHVDMTQDDYTLAPPAPRGLGARRQLLSNGRKP